MQRGLNLGQKNNSSDSGSEDHGVGITGSVLLITQRVYVTYTLTGPNDQIYIGRTSGFGTPEQLVNKRYRGHQYKDRGDRFLIPLLIKDNGYRYYDIK